MVRLPVTESSAAHNRHARFTAVPIDFLQTMPKSNQIVQESNSQLKHELRRRLQQRVSIADLTKTIADLLKPLGKKPGTPEQVATRLAKGLASKFAKQKQEL